MSLNQVQETTKFTCPKCGAHIDVSHVEPYNVWVCPHCGRESRLKTHLGRFTIIKNLGKGGEGLVYLAKDDLGRFVALKLLALDQSQNERSIQSLRREAETLASIPSHPNVVRIISGQKAEGRFFMVMEYIPGETLHDYISKKIEDKKEDYLLSLMKQVAQGLAHTASCHVLHKDVKPANIIINHQGVAKLVDFGLSQMEIHQDDNVIWGTPAYISPERLKKEKEDLRSDMYALGATFYHVFAGIASVDEHEGDSLIILEQKKHILPLIKVGAPVSERTSLFMQKLMAFHPEDRYDSYEQLLLDIDALLEHKPLSFEKTKSFGLTLRGKIFLLILGLILVFCVGFFFDLNRSLDTSLEENTSEMNDNTHEVKRNEVTDLEKKSLDNSDLVNQHERYYEESFDQAWRDLANRQFDKASQSFAKASTFARVVEDKESLLLLSYFSAIIQGQKDSASKNIQAWEDKNKSAVFFNTDSVEALAFKKKLREVDLLSEDILSEKASLCPYTYFIEAYKALSKHKYAKALGYLEQQEKIGFHNLENKDHVAIMASLLNEVKSMLENVRRYYQKTSHGILDVDDLQDEYSFWDRLRVPPHPLLKDWKTLEINRLTSEIKFLTTPSVLNLQGGEGKLILNKIETRDFPKALEFIQSQERLQKGNSHNYEILHAVSFVIAHAYLFYTAVRTSVEESSKVSPLSLALSHHNVTVESVESRGLCVRSGDRKDILDWSDVPLIRLEKSILEQNSMNTKTNKSFLERLRWGMLCFAYLSGNPLSHNVDKTVFSLDSIALWEKYGSMCDQIFQQKKVDRRLRDEWDKVIE